MTDRIDITPPEVIPPEAVKEAVVTPLEPHDFTPRLLALVANAFVWRESQDLRSRFGLGTNEWRVLSTTGRNPGVTATQISEFLDIDKAFVSRSISRLSTRNLIVLSDGARGTRPLYLTAEGVRLYDEMMPIALGSQEFIRGHFSEKQIQDLNETLRTLYRHLREDPEEAK